MTAHSSPLRGVLVAFGAYAVFAFSDASIKILHGGVPAYQIAFIGALFGCAALPFIKGRDDTWVDIVRSTNRTLWLLKVRLRRHRSNRFDHHIRKAADG